jgi:hypothetical protein
MSDVCDIHNFIEKLLDNCACDEPLSLASFREVLGFHSLTSYEIAHLAELLELIETHIPDDIYESTFLFLAVAVVLYYGNDYSKYEAGIAEECLTNYVKHRGSYFLLPRFDTFFGDSRLSEHQKVVLKSFINVGWN